MPTLNGDNAQNLAAINNNQAFNNNDERLFAMRLAAYPNAALDNTRLIVSTTLRNEGAVNQPRRSFNDDQNTKIPNNINSRAEEAASSLATYPGMSGGAVLRCRLAHNPAHKRCAIVGAVWGAERLFHNNNEIESLGSIINKTP